MRAPSSRVEETLARSPIAADVLRGLTASPKSLPARLFYDARGSELFEEITRLPEYYPTSCELEIFETFAEPIVTLAESPRAVVELGAGSAYKTRVLLSELQRQSPDVCFYPIDVSAAALDMARASLARELPTLSVKPIVGRYRAALETIHHVKGSKLVLFIGSSIGNYEIEDAKLLLADLRQALSHGDRLLLGTDLRKDPAVLLPAYDDSAGVTAAFNKNVLARINRELGGHFALSRFRHVAIWNDERSRIEMHLESVAAQRVRIDALELDVELLERERIHTENSHKFTAQVIGELLHAGQFALEERWTDRRGYFAVTLARAV